MSNPVASICNKSFYTENSKLNILCAPTHERNESFVARTDHNFYSLPHEQFKKWNSTFAPVPKNYHILPNFSLPSYLDYDLVFSQNKFGQFQILSQVACELHIPLISLEHTLPMENWSRGEVQNLSKMRGDVNVFISNYSRNKWFFEENEGLVIEHGIDTDKFTSDGSAERSNHILCVVNDWINRDYFCGYKLFMEVAKGINVKILGDTPGLSKAASSVDELIKTYQTSSIFLNTSLVSPVPMALMEAMSCGCACVSTNNCMIPEIIEHGVNGLLSNDPKELRGFLDDLLKDESLRIKLGNAARRTIVERFGLERFIKNWKRVFADTSKMFFKG